MLIYTSQSEVIINKVYGCLSPFRNVARGSEISGHLVFTNQMYTNIVHPEVVKEAAVILEDLSDMLPGFMHNFPWIQTQIDTLKTGILQVQCEDISEWTNRDAHIHVMMGRWLCESSADINLTPYVFHRYKDLVKSGVRPAISWALSYTCPSPIPYQIDPVYDQTPFNGCYDPTDILTRIISLHYSDESLGSIIKPYSKEYCYWNSNWKGLPSLSNCGVLLSGNKKSFINSGLSMEKAVEKWRSSL